MEAQTKIKHVMGEVQNDALRFGIHGVKSDIVGSHPLETLCQSAKKIEEDIKRRYIATTYGTAFPLKMDLDRQILSRFQRPTGAIPSSMVGLEGMTGGLEHFGFEHYLNEFVADAREVQEEIENFMGAGKSKRAKKKKKKDHDSLEGEELMEESKEADEDDVYFIFSGDEDCSKGMKKWITEYHQSRPGLKVLQQRIDEFITDHEAKLEQERKEREARAAEGGWTVVVHHKGRKKTTDSENGIVVGSVAQAAVEDKLAKRKKNEVGLDFYRFQRREAQRNEIMMLQSKFEQDRNRIQQLRAARKFRPY